MFFGAPLFSIYTKEVVIYYYRLYRIEKNVKRGCNIIGDVLEFIH